MPKNRLVRPFTKQVCLRVAAIACAALFVAGCPKKSSGPPSPEFEEAYRAFATLYGKHLDAAYTQPEADRILDLLDKVPEDSVSKPDAEALKKRITEGRARLLREESERSAAAAEAGKGSAPVPVADRAATSDTAAEPTPVAAQDAGATAPLVGMPVAELQSRFGVCFTKGEPILIEGVGMKDAWTLRDLGRCQEDLATFRDQILLTDAAIVRIVPKASVRLVPQGPDGGAPASPAAQDGGAGTGR